MFEFGSFAAAIIICLTIVAAILVAMVVGEKRPTKLLLAERCPSCGDGMNYIEIEDKCYACGRRMG